MSHARATTTRKSATARVAKVATEERYFVGSSYRREDATTGRSVRAWIEKNPQKAVEIAESFVVKTVVKRPPATTTRARVTPSAKRNATRAK